jgi:hypothetical protein
MALPPHHVLLLVVDAEDDLEVLAIPSVADPGFGKDQG